MTQLFATSTQSSNLDLKNKHVELISSRNNEGRVFLPLSELEALRVGGPRIPASKHGLEVICGASGETATN
jgi:hypothetical protein